MFLFLLQVSCLYILTCQSVGDLSEPLDNEPVSNLDGVIFREIKTEKLVEFITNKKNQSVEETARSDVFRNVKPFDKEPDISKEDNRDGVKDVLKGSDIFEDGIISPDRNPTDLMSISSNEVKQNVLGNSLKTSLKTKYSSSDNLVPVYESFHEDIPKPLKEFKDTLTTLSSFPVPLNFDGSNIINQTVQEMSSKPGETVQEKLSELSSNPTVSSIAFSKSDTPIVVEDEYKPLKTSKDSLYNLDSFSVPLNLDNSNPIQPTVHEDVSKSGKTVQDEVFELSPFTQIVHTDTLKPVEQLPYTSLPLKKNAANISTVTPKPSSQTVHKTFFESFLKSYTESVYPKDHENDSKLLYENPHGPIPSILLFGQIYGLQLRAWLSEIGKITLSDNKASFNKSRLLGKFTLERGFMALDLNVTFLPSKTRTKKMFPLPKGVIKGVEVFYDYLVQNIAVQYRFTQEIWLIGNIVGSCNIYLKNQIIEALLTSLTDGKGKCICEDRGLNVTINPSDYTIEFKIDGGFLSKVVSYLGEKLLNTYIVKSLLPETLKETLVEKLNDIRETDKETGPDFRKKMKEALCHLNL